MIDGDLCEQFNSMDFAKKKTIAEELDRTPAEVSFSEQFKVLRDSILDIRVIVELHVCDL